MNNLHQRFLEAAKTRTAGCPLFEGRDKGDLEDIEGKVVTLDKVWPLTGDNGGYYAVHFKEEMEQFFLSCSSLTAIIDEGKNIAQEEGCSIDEVVSGLKIRIGTMKKAKNGHKYRTMEVVEG